VVVVDLVRFCCFFEDMIGKESEREKRVKWGNCLVIRIQQTIGKVG